MEDVLRQEDEWNIWMMVGILFIKTSRGDYKTKQKKKTGHARFLTNAD